MAIPAWLTATWGDIFSGTVGTTVPTPSKFVSAKTKRRVFESNISKAVCQGMTREELNSLIRHFKSFPLDSDLFWWLHEYDDAEFERLRQIGGCPSESQVSLVIEQEKARSRKMLLIGAGAVVGVAVLAWAVMGRRKEKRRRR